MGKKIKSSLYLCGCVILILAVLVMLESNPALTSVTQTTILNSHHEDVFQFIAHADTVEMWFLWISHFRSADRKPLGVGKQYQAVYSVPVLGDHVLLFRVTKYVPDTCIVLESESLFRPRFEIMSSPVSNGDQTKLTFRLLFRRSSLFFQYTMGPILQLLSRHYIQNALSFLHNL